MKQSEDIALLSEALAKAQSEIEAAKKDSKNPFFKSSYADLNSIYEAIKEVLAKHGIAVPQSPTRAQSENAVGMTTRLLHKSGQWLEDTFDMPIVKRDPQAVGSAITYARRYGLVSMMAVPTEDDDGESAMNRAPTSRQQPKPAYNANMNASTASNNQSYNGPHGPTEAMLKRVFAIKSNYGWSDQQVKDVIQKEFSLDSSKKLNRDQYNQLCDEILPAGPAQVM